MNKFKWMLYFGISLLFVPIYFYLVEEYQPILSNWYFGRELRVIDTISFFTVYIGLFLIPISLDKLSKQLPISTKKIMLLHLCFVMGFLGTWLYTTHIIAYFGVIIFFIPSIMILLDTLVNVILVTVEFYKHLESIEKVTILVPILTVVLNSILN